jgi:hypothetical protein
MGWEKLKEQSGVTMESFVEPGRRPMVTYRITYGDAGGATSILFVESRTEADDIFAEMLRFAQTRPSSSAGPKPE